MRWLSVVAALGLGMLGGAGWVLWDQHQEARAIAAPAAVPASSSEIPLKVLRDGQALRLRWSGRAQAIQTASRGTLIITDGTHQSTLQLDGRELRSGLASYWPDSDRVKFRLETDTGAAGSIETAAGAPRVALAKVAERPPAAPVRNPVPVRRRLKPPEKSGPPPRIDDGLEWTEQPPDRPVRPVVQPLHKSETFRAQVVPRKAAAEESRPASRWSRLKRKLPFWRKPPES